MNKKTLQTLQEKAESLNLNLLIENYQLHIHPNQIEIFEKTQFIESTEGDKFKARAVIRNVPTSKFTENLNGRIYPKELDEKLIKEKVAEGTLSLADHPEDEGSIKNICGVWHNARLGEKFSFGDWYLVGEFGDLIKETIEAGGKIGVSRVGFGEFLEDGKTVNKKSYVLERWGDAVISPSQEVFATFENIQESLPIENKITNNKENKEDLSESSKIIQRKKEEVKNMEKYDKLNHRGQIKEAIRVASSMENLSEAIGKLTALEVDPEMTDLQEKVQSTVSSLEKKLEGQRVKANEELEEVKKQLKEMSDKYNRAKSIVEKIGLDESINIDELQETVGGLQEKVKVLESNNEEMKKDLDVVGELFEDENIKKLEITNPSEFKDLAEDTIKRDEDITFLKEEMEKYQSYLSEAEIAIKEREEKLAELGFKFDEEDDKEKEDDKEDEKKEMEDDDEKKEMKKKEEGKKAEKEEEEGEEKEEEEEEEDKEEMKEETIEEYKFQYNHGEQRALRNNDTQKIEEKKEVKVNESKEVQLFVEREVRKNPAYKDIEDELLKSKDLKEAIKKLDSFEEKKEEPVEVKESIASRIQPVKKPDWLGNRK